MFLTQGVDALGKRGDENSVVGNAGFFAFKDIKVVEFYEYDLAGTMNPIEEPHDSAARCVRGLAP